MTSREVIVEAIYGQLAPGVIVSGVTSTDNSKALLVAKQALADKAHKSSKELDCSMVQSWLHKPTSNRRHRTTAMLIRSEP